MEVLVTTGAVRRANLQRKCHRQRTNTQFFYRPAALPVAQPTVSARWFTMSSCVRLLLLNHAQTKVQRSTQPYYSELGSLVMVM